jgi:energy-coupling factor transport system permease protein
VIQGVVIGQFIPGKSLLHKADPRVKIILSLIFMVCIFMINTFTGFFMCLCFLLIVILSSNLPFKLVIRGLKPILLLVIITALINIFTISGSQSLFKWGIINITVEGLVTTFKLCMRLVLVITGASLLTLTTSPITLTDGIEKLFSPLKIVKFPAHEIAMMMSIALRFIPTLLDETDKIMKAQASRGANFDEGNFIKRAKSYIPVLVPLFVSAFERASDLAVAMDARCYRGGVGRTKMKQLKVGIADLFVVLTLLIFITGVLLLNTCGGI